MFSLLKNKYSQLLQIKATAPSHIARKFSGLSHGDEPTLEHLIRENLLKPLDENYHCTAEGKADIQMHISGRLNHFRNYYIPWINSLKTIKGSTILEIGSGSGASTQALAEQGGEVDGIDVDDKVLEIARFRLEHTGQKATLHLLNANMIGNSFSGRQFDIIIFFAALEHMTTDERIDSLQQAYSLLKNNGILFVLEAPNRLWLYDFHTAFMPFFLWLPNDLAIKYAHRSDRKLFKTAFNTNTSETELARWGRGASYHEFQLAQIPDQAISLATGVFDYHMRGQILKQLLYRRSLNYRYKKVLRKMAPPGTAACFLEPFLDVAITKKQILHQGR